MSQLKCNNNNLSSLATADLTTSFLFCNIILPNIFRYFFKRVFIFIFNCPSNKL